MSHAKVKDARLHPKHERKCLECGTAFFVEYPKKKTKYCSSVCYGRAKSKSLGVPTERKWLHQIYKGMVNRCENPAHLTYSSYGGRGVCVCREWREDRQAFYEWAMATGFSVGMEIDRIDATKGYEPNNCRWATRSQNKGNRSKARTREFSSQFKGVTLYCGKKLRTKPWLASIGIEGKRVSLGSFATERDAAAAYNRAAEKHFGEYAKLNDIPE
jgi:hypothetical protein